MATLTSTQNGDIAASATFGGTAPSNGDQLNLEHDHTLEANFTQIGTSVELKNGSTLDTRNAADSTNYNLVCKKIVVRSATFNMRDGHHKFWGDGSTGAGLNSYANDAVWIWAGGTVECIIVIFGKYSSI